jgi:hypothetical protein
VVGRTPDARDGPLWEESVIWEEQASDPAPAPDGYHGSQYVTGKGLVILEDGVVRGIGESRVNVWQYPVDDRDVNAPPGSPATGYRVIVGGSPTGAFVGHAGEIAQWTGTAWVFTTPKAGTVVHVRDEAQPVRQTALAAPWSWSLFSLVPHASTHEDGGSDELTVQNLGSGAAPIGKLLQADGAGGWDLVDYPSPTPELNYGSYTTPYSTSSGSYQQVWRYTTPALSAGSFIVIVQADLNTTNAGNVTNARVQIDDVTTIASWIGPVAYVGGNKPLIGIRIHVFTAGTHNIDFDIRKASGNGNVIMTACYVQIWRVE